MKRPSQSLENHDPTTPNQPTAQKNPVYSGDSVDPTEEENTKRMILTLVESILLGLGSDFHSIPWPQFAQNCRLNVVGYSLFKHSLR